MGQAKQGQAGKDPVVAEADVGRDRRKAHQQRDQAPLEQLVAQGGANRVDRDLLGIHRANHRRQALDQGAGLFGLKVRKPQVNGTTAIQDLNAGIDQLGSRLAAHLGQGQGTQLLTDLGSIEA